MRRALEGVRQALWVAKVALSHPNPERLEIGRLLWIADADADLVGWDALGELLNDEAAELTCGSGDDDH